MHRRSVPVNQWKISFSGEPNSANRNDLSIHDFIEQRNMFRIAEKIPENDLLSQEVHLLSEKARAWY